ncbi:sarcosine dehydrogenase, mitochondrial [Caerostris extrusa]|uniref:Sarcosine dehydrogenase, mitochondrial n=1 Tax=Caerostris extrusa TaxID=172846 RepID=A0AAV4P450_CAEEX|nr:sarcosine dehydrogenase, mitochondrial [Caerostris extrusa]
MISLAGHKVLAIRLSFVGEMGWELHIPYESCVPVYKALMDKGSSHGILNAGYRAIDSLSLEKGARRVVESPGSGADGPIVLQILSNGESDSDVQRCSD